MFISSTKDYDFVIHVDPKYTLPGIRSKGSKFKNLQKTGIAPQDIAKLGLNIPHTFVDELKVSPYSIAQLSRTLLIVDADQNRAFTEILLSFSQMEI